MDLLNPDIAPQRFTDVQDAIPLRNPQTLQDLLWVDIFGSPATEAVEAELQRTKSLLQSLLEGRAYRHRLSDRLHLRSEDRVGQWELLEAPARQLGDDVVDGRLE